MHFNHGMILLICTALAGDAGADPTLKEVVTAVLKYRETLGDYEITAEVSDSLLTGVYMIRENSAGDYLVDIRQLKEKDPTSQIKSAMMTAVAVRGDIRDERRFDGRSGVRVSHGASKGLVRASQRRTDMRPNILTLLSGDTPPSTQDSARIRDMLSSDMHLKVWDMETEGALIKLTRYGAMAMGGPGGTVVDVRRNKRPIRPTRPGAPPGAEDEKLVVYWCDPSKDNLVVAVELWDRDRVFIRTKVARSVQVDGLWLPAEGHVTTSGRKGEDWTVTYRLIEAKVNQTFTSDDMKLDWGDGTPVTVVTTADQSQVPETKVLKGKEGLEIDTSTPQIKFTIRKVPASRPQASNVTHSVAAATKPVPAERKPVSGVVVDDAGQPVSGVRVEVATAKPVVGPQYKCPSCYLDCGKATISGLDGRFRIASLSSDLIFTLLMLKAGYRTSSQADVHPGDENIRLTIPRIDLRGIPEEQLLRVEVKDPQGEPVSAAVIDVVMRRFERGGRSCSVSALCGQDGTAVIDAREPGTGYDVRVSRDGFAPRYLPRLKPGRNPNLITLTTGASLAGKVFRSDAEGLKIPMGGVTVGAIGPRIAEGFLPVAYAYADEHGGYLFSNLAPDREYDVFVVCNGTGSQSGYSAPPRKAEALKEGERRTGFDFELREARTIRGRIHLPEGSAPVESGRATAFISNAWGGVSGLIAADGSFELQGLPPTDVEVRVRVPGYELAGLPQPHRWGEPPIRVMLDQDAELEIWMQKAAPPASRPAQQSTVQTPP